MDTLTRVDGAESAVVSPTTEYCFRDVLLNSAVPRAPPGQDALYRELHNTAATEAPTVPLRPKRRPASDSKDLEQQTEHLGA